MEIKELHEQFRQCCDQLPPNIDIEGVTDEVCDATNSRRTSSQHRRELTIKLNECLRLALITRTFRRFMVQEFGCLYIVGVDDIPPPDTTNITGDLNNLIEYFDQRWVWLFKEDFSTGGGFFSPIQAPVLEQRAYKQYTRERLRLSQLPEQVLDVVNYAEFALAPETIKAETKARKIMREWRQEFIDLHHSEP